jgi:integrase
MAVRKRGDTWVIDYYEPSGKRVQKGGFKTRKAAKLEESARLEAIDQGTYYEKAKTYTTTFDELVKDYEKFCKVDNRSYKRSKSYIVKALTKEFSGRVLSKISYHDLISYQTKLRSTRGAKGGILTVATVNRYMACLRHMMALAVEWGKLDQNPFDKGRSLQLKENNKRERFLTEEEIQRLLAECPTAHKRFQGKFVEGTQAVHLKDFIIISINTGMRKGEVLSLKWDQIRGGLIYLRETKTDMARQIPINDDLAECLRSIRTRQMKQGIDSKFVICDEKGRRIKDIRTSFNSAIKRAGIKNFRPHDLRHTFASHFLMRTRDMKSLQEILGHTEIKTTMRYSHLLEGHKQDCMNQMNGLTSDKNKAGSDILVTFPKSDFATTS